MSIDCVSQSIKVDSLLFKNFDETVLAKNNEGYAEAAKYWIKQINAFMFDKQKQGLVGNVLEGNVTQKPTFLTQIGDAYQILIGKDSVKFLEQKAKNFLGVENLTEEEKSALSTFAAFFKEANAKYAFTELLASQVPEDKSEVVNLDLSRQLTTAGKQNDQVKAAVIIAAYQAVTDLNNQKKLDKENFSKLFKAPGKDEHDISYEFYNKHGDGQMVLTTAFNRWGKYVTRTLGLRADKTGSPNVFANLQTGLGGQVHGLLKAMQLTWVHPIEASELIAEGLAKEGTTNRKYLIRLSTEADNAKPVVTAQRIKESVAGSKNIVTNLFDVTTERQWPSLKPIAQVDETTDSGMKVPKLLQESLKAFQKQAWTVNESAYDYLIQIAENQGIEAVYQLFGAKSEEAIATEALYIRKNLQAARNGIIREVDDLFEFINSNKEAALKGGFYLKTSVWLAQRVGISSRIDLTGSKIHRYLIQGKNWNTTVNLNDADAVNSFKLRVAEGLDVSTDKASNEVSLQKFTQIEQSKKFKAAIDSIFANENSADAINALLNKVGLSGGARAKGYAALIEYSKYKAALQQGETSFDTSIMVEVDGVSNGPILTLLMMATSVAGENFVKFFKKGGFYTTDETKDFNVYRGTENASDLYETVGKKSNEFVTDYIKNKKVPTNSTFNEGTAYFTAKVNEEDETEYVTRSGIKSGVNPLTFGSGIAKAIDSMFDDLVDAIYSRIGEINRMPEETEEQKLAKQEALSEYLTNLKKLGIDAPSDLKTLVDKFYISKKELKYMKSNYGAKYEYIKGQKVLVFAGIGGMVGESLSQQFDSFLKFRNQFTQTTKVAADIYFTARESLIQKKREEKGINQQTGIVVGLTQEDLDAIEQELFNAGLTPVIDSVSSKLDLDKKAGIKLLSTEKGAGDDIEYRTKVTTKTGVVAKGGIVNTAYSEKTYFTDPGVLGTSIGTHSLDAFISWERLKELAKAGIASINVHDSGGTVLEHGIAMAKSFNKHTLRALINYTPAVAIAEMVVANMEGFIKLGLALPVPEGFKSSKEFPTYEDKVLSDLLGFVSQAYTAEKQKLEYLASVKHVSQYALEGGSYEVTSSDRQLIENKLAETNKKFTEAINKVSSFKFSKKAEAVPAPVLIDTTITAAPELANLTSGLVDTHVPTAPQWQGALNEVRTASGTSLDKLLEAVVNEGSQAYLKPVAALLKGTNTPVYVVDNPSAISNKKHKDIVFAGLTKGKGVPSGVFVDGTIYLFDETNKHNGVILVHEAVHAVVNAYIEKLEANKDSLTGEDAVIYKNLNDLYNSVKEQLKGSEDQQIQFALENLNEFIAYGLTSKKIQQTLQKLSTNLDNTQVKSFYRNNAFVEFVRFIAEAAGKAFTAITNGKFDKRKTVELNNALTALLAESANAIQRAKQVSNPSNTAYFAHTVNGVTGYDTRDLFDALADPQKPLGASESAHLTGLLDKLVNAVYGPFGAYKEALMAQTNLSEIDIVNLASAQQLNPLTQANTGLLNQSQQERFVADQIASTINVALQDSQNFHYKRMLEKVYKQAKKDVTPQMLVADWNAATAQEKQEAQDLHDFLFNNFDLAAFSAIGLTNTKFSNILNSITTNLEETKIQNTLFNILNRVFNKLMNFFNKKISGVSQGQPMSVSLKNLIDSLIRHEVTVIAARKESFVDRATKVIDNQIKDKTYKASTKLIKSSLSQWMARKSNVAGLVKDIAEQAALDRLGKVGSAYERGANKYGTGKATLVGSLIGEVVGETDYKQPVINMLSLSKGIEAERERTIQNTINTINKQFVENGAYLTKEMKKSITSLLRTGISITDYPYQQIKTFVENNKELQKEIDLLTRNIKKNAKQHSKAMLYQAEALGNYLSTGQNRSEIGLNKNATAIAQMIGLPSAGAIADVSLLVPDLEKLISLYAIQYMNSLDKAELKKVMLKEVSPDNGLWFTLGMHKRSTTEAKTRLFKGSEILMSHGYMPEVVNPNVSVIYVTAAPGRTAKQAAEFYEKAGYTNYGLLKKDSSDPTQHEVYMLVNHNVPETRRLTGVFSYISNNAKGSKLHDGDKSSLFSAVNKQMTDAVTAKNQQAFVTLRKTGLVFDSTSPANKMSAILNANGEIVNYSYEATHTFRDNVLDRNNNFDYLLGKLNGTIYEKPTTKEHNARLVQILKDIYDAPNSTVFKTDYVLIGPRSPVKEHRENYALLSYETRQEIEKIWGKDGMFVNKNILDLVFGYKKIVIGDMMQENKLQQSMAIRGLTKALGYALTISTDPQERKAGEQRAAVLMKRIQRGAEEIVQETKDWIVIKTGFVLLQNEMSNLTLLRLKGVGVVKAAKLKAIATEALNVYRVQATRAFELESYLSTGVNAANHDAYRKELADLQKSMSNSPLAPLLKAGMEPTVVEDVETDSDDYSYKEQLFGKISEKVDKLGTLGLKVKTVGNQLYLNKDTGLYQFMRYATQVSDFSARFALYTHLKETTQKTDEEIISEIRFSFIFYDVPSHRGLQFLNDVGLVYFTKFLLRIQAPLYRALRENPTNGLLMWLAGSWLDSVETVTESHFTNKLYSPFRSGPLELVNVVDDLATVQAITAPVGFVTE